jgi:Phospholipase_D-nuclease N-terminal
MLLFDGGLGLILFAVWVFCIIDVITTPEGESRNLPKIAWLFIVIILVDAGSIAWLVAGRSWGGRRGDLSYTGGRGAPRQTTKRRATNPDDDDEFLANLRARTEEQRRRAREAEPRDEPPAPPPTA